MHKLLVILFLAIALPTWAQVKVEPVVIRSGEWIITADAKAAVARREGQKETVVLFREKRDNQNREGEFYNLLSVVGGVVSYHHSFYYEGGAHPSYGSMFITADLDNNREPADIRKFFEEQLIVKALLEDSLIRVYMNGIVTDKLVVMLDNIDGDCAINFQPLPTAWSINTIGEGEAEICFGLPHGCEVMRGNFTTIKVKIPYRESVAADFEEASKSNSTMGYLYPEP
jgi:hypothetical protein